MTDLPASLAARMLRMMAVALALSFCSLNLRTSGARGLRSMRTPSRPSQKQKMSRVNLWLVQNRTSLLHSPRARTASHSFHALAKVTEVR